MEQVSKPTVGSQGTGGDLAGTGEGIIRLQRIVPESGHQSSTLPSLFSFSPVPMRPKNALLSSAWCVRSSSSQATMNAETEATHRIESEWLCPPSSRVKEPGLANGHIVDQAARNISLKHFARVQNVVFFGLWHG